MSLVIGLTGANAAGKGVIAAHLETAGFRIHSLSDIVREEAAARGLPARRAELIRVGTELRREHGPGVLAERILARLGARDVVDSIRNPAEVEVLRRVEGFVLIGVRAPVKLRFERSRSRNRPGDAATLEAFRAREAEENTADPNAQQLDATLALADTVVDNDGDLERLHRLVDGLVARWTGVR